MIADLTHLAPVDLYCSTGFPAVPYEGWSVNIHPMRSMARITGENMAG